MIFDASSIIAAVKEGKPKLLAGNRTCELAYYETGNAIWKEVKLFKSISSEEAETLMKIFLSILKLMRVEKPDYTEVIKLAYEYGVSFYDASYVQLAVQNNDILVTEDEKLRRKVKDLIKVKSIRAIGD